MSAARRRRASKGRRQKSGSDGGHARSQAPILKPPLRVLHLPLALALALVVLSLLPRVQDNLRLAWSFWGTAAALLIWQSALFVRLRGASARRALESAIRPQHYVQATI